jgi:hypothetical protein
VRVPGFIRGVRSTFRKLNALAEAMERTPYDDLADRISRLEQELTQLKRGTPREVNCEVGACWACALG